MRIEEAKQLVAKLTEQNTKRESKSPKTILPEELCQLYIKQQANKTAETAVELGYGAGRVHRNTLDKALNQHFDAVSAGRMLAFILSTYGAPICDDELHEWSSMSEKCLMSIIVYARTANTQIDVEVTSKEPKIIPECIMKKRTCCRKKTKKGSVTFQKADATIGHSLRHSPKSKKKILVRAYIRRHVQ